MQEKLEKLILKLIITEVRPRHIIRKKVNIHRENKNSFTSILWNLILKSIKSFSVLLNYCLSNFNTLF